MGFMDRLFGKADDPQAAPELFQEGRTKMWARQFGEADRLLGRAARHHRLPELPLAYRSLLLRAQKKTREAIQTADQGIKAAPSSFEAHAARCVALLTLPSDMESIVGAYDQATRLAPSDPDGHFLRLALFLLFYDMIRNAEETAQGVTLNFTLTPLTRMAIRLFDFQPEGAIEEVSNLPSSLVVELGLGLSYYRLGRHKLAVQNLRTVLDHERASKTKDSRVQSEEALLRECEARSGPKG